MELKNKSHKNLSPIYSEEYQHVGFQQPTAPAPDQHVVITQQPQQVIVQNLILNQKVGAHPCTIVCPTCRKQIRTKIRLRNNYVTHAFAFILCMMLCWCICWIPYCIKSCKNHNHFCPECETYIGLYNPMSNRDI